VHLKGTPPYTSGEILSGGRYFDHGDSVFHDAVHDLESFFWVLIHMCITRRGPGGVRREELEQKNQEGIRRRTFLFQYRYGHDGREQKENLHSSKRI